MKAFLICFGLCLSSLMAHATAGHAKNQSPACAYGYADPELAGEVLTIMPGTFVSNLHGQKMLSRDKSWNNEISSLYVSPGCQMVAYQYDNFGRDFSTGERIGAYEVYTHGAYYYLGGMNELISSYTCHCQQ